MRRPASRSTARPSARRSRDSGYSAPLRRGNRKEFAYNGTLAHHELRNVTCLMGDISKVKIEVRLVSDGGHEVER